MNNNNQELEQENTSEATQKKELTQFQEDRLNALRDYYIKHIDQFIKLVAPKGDREKQILLELANNNKGDCKYLLSQLKQIIDHAYMFKERLILCQKIREHRKASVYRKSLDYIYQNHEDHYIERPQFYAMLKKEGDNRLDEFEHSDKALRTYNVGKRNKRNDKT